MRTLDLIRRASHKSPGYLARRALREIRRLARPAWLQWRMRTLTADSLARALRSPSLQAFWQEPATGEFLYPPSERDTLRRCYKSRYLEESGILRDRVERILNHEFDLLGSGPTQLGKEIDWHLDFKSGRRWDLTASEKIDYAELDRPSDVKVAWELSRCHHFVTLGQAWLLYRDENAVREFQMQIQSWISANPVGFGVNWSCTMEVALRALNWIWALALFADVGFPSEFLETVLICLYRHGLWIPEHLELSEVTGNHYLADVLGMTACGAFFRRSKQGERWLTRGARMLEEEILSQVESDGVDIEGSVAYHRLVLEMFLTGGRMLESVGRPPSAGYRSRLEQMIEFVHAYTSPCGLAPAVGDADDGRVLIFGKLPARDHRYLISTGCALFDRGDWKNRAKKFWEDSFWLLGSASLEKFERLKKRAGPAFPGFPVSGFHILRSGRQYLFIDAGPVGFRGLGGHGHNDCLSFEWHVGERPLLTDSGLYVYTASPEWRNRFRSTSFHNTIMVDGEEINRFLIPPTLWFLGNDAQPLEVRSEPRKSHESLRAGHTGYRRLPDPVTVFRTFELDKTEAALRLIDRLEGKAEHRIDFFFHAAPGCAGKVHSESGVEFIWQEGYRLLISRHSGSGIQFALNEGWFAPVYGIKLPRPVCIATMRVSLPIEIVWDLRASEI